MTFPTVPAELLATPVVGHRIEADTFGGVIDERGHPLLVVFLRHYG